MKRVLEFMLQIMDNNYNFNSQFVKNKTVFQQAVLEACNFIKEEG